ncbi:hypothetical protein SKAU_G00086890 [Synaphobranchus kaupii]|uniref:Uncharacterized protein n=1 Tax=Synaphobranchus kaupii TaxID=118154 RepID=A0A9Q1FWT3_SYNKA|nr:hypothetical protein SKAU_G00086890 [Synaphobranchus kaupii]
MFISANTTITIAPKPTPQTQASPQPVSAAPPPPGVIPAAAPGLSQFPGHQRVLTLLSSLKERDQSSEPKDKSPPAQPRRKLKT